MFKLGATGRRTSGFTLVELLVVILIIMVLASIAFPVLAVARNRAKQTGCESNMKAAGMALLMYAQDYDMCFPTANCVPDDAQNVMALVLPYIQSKDILQCACAPHNIALDDADQLGEPYATQFGMPRGDYPVVVALRNSGDPCGPTSMPDIGRAVILAETRYHSTGPTDMYQSRGWGWCTFDCKDPINNLVPDRHQQGSVYVFADGHVKYFQAAAVPTFYSPDKGQQDNAQARFFWE